MIMCHMIADSTEELLRMVDQIGVKRKWIQDFGTPREHFDISLAKKKLALKYGAVEIHFKELATKTASRKHRVLKPVIKVFFDVETTGVDFRRHSIHQLAGCVEVDGVVDSYFNYDVAPHPKAEITPEAMAISGRTEEQIRKFPPMGVVHKQFLTYLGKYINKFDRQDKAYLVGFNNRYFDDSFLRKMFELCGDTYFNSWFWSDTLDTMVLASEYLIGRRDQMKNFKLGTVAQELGIEVNPDSLHDSKYDVDITRAVYRIVTGKEIEL